MEATLTNDITADANTSQQIVKNTKTYRQNNSKEFLFGVLYLIKKVFLLK